MRQKLKVRSTNFMLLFLSSSSIISTGLNVVSGLFVTKWMMPEELGSFNSFTLISGYLILFQLGIPSGLGRELPYFLGIGDKEKAYGYAGVANYWQGILGSVIFAICVIISLFYLLSERNFQMSAGVFVIGAITFQVLYTTKYLKVLFRTNKDFNKLSWINIINAFVSLGGIVFVWAFGFLGLCLRALIGALIDFMVTYSWRPIKVKAVWKRQPFMDLFKLGLPMYGVANVYSLWPLIQRTLILTLGGKGALGLFALATMVEAAAKTVSNSMNVVMYPTMATAWGRGYSVGQIFQVVLKPFGLALIFYLVVIPVGWYLLPAFVDGFIPNYKEGVEAAQWMLVVGGLSLTGAYANVYNVVKDQKNRLINYLSGIFTWLICVLILYDIRGFQLVIFVQSMVAALVVMMILNFWYVWKRMDLVSKNI